MVPCVYLLKYVARRLVSLCLSRCKFKCLLELAFLYVCRVVYANVFKVLVILSFRFFCFVGLHVNIGFFKVLRLVSDLISSVCVCMCALVSVFINKLEYFDCHYKTEIYACIHAHAGIYTQSRANS